MKLTVLQEKLHKSKMFGSKYVALHAGPLSADKSSRITGIFVQPESKGAIIYTDGSSGEMSIDTFLKMLADTFRVQGDIEIKGSFTSGPYVKKDPDEIKTVCVIADLNGKKHNEFRTLISLTDLSKESQ